MKRFIAHMMLCLLYVIPAQANADSLSFTLEELMSMRNDVMPLLDVIASGEGNYNSVNRGRAGDSRGDWPKKNLGKSITEMSIKEIREHQGGRTEKCWYNGKKGKANLFAVGRYQLIPCTLQYATVSIEDLDLRTIYEPEVQDAFGAFLLFVKRPVVGEYLLGEHNDFKEAGQELAKEFASVPIQYSHGKCKRGQSYYCGDKAGNKAHISLEAIERAMKQVRKNLKDDKKTQHMVEEKRGFGKRLVHWWKRMWGNVETPPLTTPLVNTMDHTLFDYIYHTEGTATPSIPEGVLELLQVPATNLVSPSEKESTDDSSSKPADTMKVNPDPPVQPQKTEPPKEDVPETDVHDDIDNIDDVRIVPKDEQ